MSRLRLRVPSPALVVAVVALVIALGGTSYAAFTIGTKNIRNGAVTNSKLSANSVGTFKIRNGAVTASKINTSGLSVPSASALSGVQWVENSSVANAPGAQNYGQANCPAGLNAVAGGVYGSSGGTTQSVNSSFPVKTAGATVPNAWGAYVNNAGATASTFNVYAVCASVTSPSAYTGFAAQGK